MVHDGKLWITGGAGSPKTSEWIGLDQPPIKGPNLPMNFVNHCMTRINETHVILIGGIDNNGQTLIIDVGNDFKMTAGPNLKYARSGHACGTYSTPYGNQIVVAGGEIYLRDNYTEIFLKTTEIWNPAIDKDWLQGMYKSTKKARLAIPIKYDFTTPFQDPISLPFVIFHLW